MVTKIKNEAICGDIFNSLSHQCKNFHWSTPYQWYVNLLAEQKKNNKIWTDGLENAACVLEFFDLKEIVYLFERYFDPKTRTNIVGLKRNPIPLTPKAFKRKFKLPKPNNLLNFLEANSFLYSQANRMNIIQEFISLTYQVPFDICFLDISIFPKNLIRFFLVFSLSHGMGNHIQYSKVCTLCFV